MGWDAHTNAEKDWDKKQLKNPKIDKMFLEADEYVKNKTGTVDFYLRMAGLDVSTCGKMLETATGMSVYDERGWDSDFVQKLNKKANWNFPYEKEDAWAYYSAKKFLQACAKSGLSITFSW